MQKNCKRIAAITIVRNDDFFLKKWVEYYGEQLGRGNLYVLFDGRDQVVPDFCMDLHCEICDRSKGNVRQGDKGRIRIVSLRACRLFQEGYQAVIGCDVDEYLVVDPLLGTGLKEFILGLKGSCASALGIDVGQDTRCEGVLDFGRKVLRQRRTAKLSTRYTKACVMLSQGEWGSGFHRQSGRNFHIAQGLYLFHLGVCDLRMLENRTGDKDLIGRGWARHFAKRARTIKLCSTLGARGFDRWAHFARICQTWCRPPYAWNKPAMLGMDIVVRIPDRFAGTL